MEHNLENSEAQAHIIRQIALPVFMLDKEYCRSAAERMFSDASKYDSIAAMNRNYSPLKSKMMKQKAEALMKLVEYGEALKEIQGLQKDLENEEKVQSNIDAMFF